MTITPARLTPYATADAAAFATLLQPFADVLKANTIPRGALAEEGLRRRLLVASHLLDFSFADDIRRDEVLTHYNNVAYAVLVLGATTFQSGRAVVLGANDAMEVIARVALRSTVAWPGVDTDTLVEAEIANDLGAGLVSVAGSKDWRGTGTAGAAGIRADDAELRPYCWLQGPLTITSVALRTRCTDLGRGATDYQVLGASLYALVHRNVL